MDFISLSKTNRLYWLGRYYERVALSLQYMMNCYDSMIDSDYFDYGNYCAKLGIENNYSSAEEFFKSYVYDVKNPDSIRFAAEMMLGNGMVLRETIGSSTLAYLQMAVYALDEGAEDSAPGLMLLEVLDNIMAFRGSYDDFIVDDNVRNIIKCGASVECISFSLRTGYREEALHEELQKFLKRMTRTSIQTEPQALQTILKQERVYEGKSQADSLSQEDFLQAIENLFQV